ncbi:MAG: hypothetical protein H0V81_08355 [Solirubrobacterales bacterium]|nr:hypothetical protein [Solirubrobacterales bacterium]
MSAPVRTPGFRLGRMAAWAAAPPPAPPEPKAASGPTCELCPVGLAEDHAHLLQLDERRIVCVCQTCWSLRSGDAEYRPAGDRTLWLEDFVLSEDVWSSLQMPIGLAFLMRSGASGGVHALYPSPAGATESELDLSAWDELRAANPILDRLEPDAEGLIINRMASPTQVVIVPIDECYRLVGMVKASWEGISGGNELEAAVGDFFTRLRARAIG